ncbi:MAG: nitrous oxide reductase family maturation protein NosD [Candidatus Heimdallarchaeota archaeon]
MVKSQLGEIRLRPSGWAKNSSVGISVLFLFILPILFGSYSLILERYRLINEKIEKKPVLKEKNPSRYNYHPPIKIEGNWEAVSTATNENWPGNGTLASPYVIQNYNITTRPSMDWGDVLIGITDTDLYFIIRNCFLKGGYIGIRLDNASGVQISNNVLINNYASVELSSVGKNEILNSSIIECRGNGVFLLYSGKSSIRGNKFSDILGTAISLWNSGGSIISHNIIASIWGDGISLRTSGNNTIINNVLLNRGITISGSSISDFIQNLVDNNTLNGKFLVYMQNLDGVTVPMDAAQVAMVNCTNIILESRYLSNVSIGALVAFSSGIEIVRNVISNNIRIGISLINVTKCVISDNIIILNHGDGIKLYKSTDCLITNNTFTQNVQRGISLFYSQGNSITWNKFIENSRGTVSQAFDDSNRNTFAYNYWNDWISPDLNQDGLVDLPYAVDGHTDNQDRFPRTSPTGRLSEGPDFRFMIVSALIVTIAVLLILPRVKIRLFGD